MLDRDGHAVEWSVLLILGWVMIGQCGSRSCVVIRIDADDGGDPGEGALGGWRVAGEGKAGSALADLPNRDMGHEFRTVGLAASCYL